MERSADNLTEALLAQMVPDLKNCPGSRKKEKQVSASPTSTFCPAHKGADGRPTLKAKCFDEQCIGCLEKLSHILGKTAKSERHQRFLAFEFGIPTLVTHCKEKRNDYCHANTIRRNGLYFKLF
ncbi:hypothetical protein M514_08024 [Trichuris suis]|uniref:Uncharacterized protein n=1 Tax=Trichuris suis TaxID=68888 RepID=A0A085M1M8_9BILA|nr:hypothetical protein M513_08024 [Trichuris suis]KFD60980.1 hypothetical protein M514_08024 [Trichuris suis]